MSSLPETTPDASPPLPPLRLHIFGASGAGTTTLGRAFADRHNATFLDTDDFFWHPTDPPYQRRRDRVDRLRLLTDTTNAHPRWVISGSLCGWGDPLTRLFHLAVFLSTPTDIRLVRLHNRESARFGHRLSPTGDMHTQHQEFMAWAATYDQPDAPTDGRNRALHERWSLTLPCPLLHLDGTHPIPHLCHAIATALSLSHPQITQE